MAFSPSRGSQDTLVSISGASLLSTTGVFLVSGLISGQCSLVSTSTNVITFYPPSTPPGNLRSGQFQIYNKFGTGIERNYFTWIQTPYISGIAPLSGFTGTNFKISGSGCRDLTGLYFTSPVGTYTGVLSTPVFENSTWICSGQVGWMSGGLNSFVNIKGMNEGGFSIAPQLFFVREDGISLSGIVGFPSPIQTYNYLRGNSTADALEWQTPNQVLASISGIFRSGDIMSGDLTMTGAALNTTGIKLLTTGTSTGHVILTNRIFSGNYIISEAKIGGVTWRAFSLGIS